MAIFYYTAKDKEGKTEKGRIEADHKEYFLETLRANGLYCTHYKQRQKLTFNFSKKVSIKQLIEWTRQLGTMVQVGLPMNQCMTILYTQNPDPFMKKVLLELAETIQKGNSLSLSLKKQNDIFPKLLIHMIACGEESGTLDKLLLSMADYYEEQNAIKNQLQNAMAYPIVLGVTSLAVIIGILLFVIPIFAEVFSAYGELPFMTRCLIGLSNGLKHYTLQILGAIGSIFLLGILFFRQPSVRMGIAKLKLQLPQVGKLNRMILSNKFAKTMGTLYGAGIPLIVAMDMTKEVLENTYAEPLLSQAREAVGKGMSLANAIEHMGIFPPMLSQMIRVGEESGKLEVLLEKSSQYYQEEVRTMMQKLVALAEPLMILVLGGVVACIVLGMITPMYQMMGSIG